MQKLSPDVGHKATGDPARVVRVHCGAEQHRPDQPEGAEQWESELWNGRKETTCLSKKQCTCRSRTVGATSFVGEYLRIPSPRNYLPCQTTKVRLPYRTSHNDAENTSSWVLGFRPSFPSPQCSAREKAGNLWFQLSCFDQKKLKGQEPRPCRSLWVLWSSETSQRGAFEFDCRVICEIALGIVFFVCQSHANWCTLGTAASPQRGFGACLLSLLMTPCSTCNVIHKFPTVRITIFFSSFYFWEPGEKRATRQTTWFETGTWDFVVRFLDCLLNIMAKLWKRKWRAQGGASRFSPKRIFVINEHEFDAERIYTARSFSETLDGAMTPDSLWMSDAYEFGSKPVKVLAIFC